MDKVIVTFIGKLTQPWIQWGRVSIGTSFFFNLYWVGLWIILYQIFSNILIDMERHSPPLSVNGTFSRKRSLHCIIGENRAECRKTVCMDLFPLLWSMDMMWPTTSSSIHGEHSAQLWWTIVQNCKCNKSLSPLSCLCLVFYHSYWKGS